MIVAIFHSFEIHHNTRSAAAFYRPAITVGYALADTFTTADNHGHKRQISMAPNPLIDAILLLYDFMASNNTVRLINNTAASTAFC